MSKVKLKTQTMANEKHPVRRSELDPLRGLVLPEGLLRFHSARRRRRRRRRRVLRERIPYRYRSGDRHCRRDEDNPIFLLTGLPEGEGCLAKDDQAVTVLRHLGFQGRVGDDLVFDKMCVGREISD